MHKPDDSRIFLPDESATEQLASRLASALKPGTIIWFHGDLGAGKTTTIRYLLRALGYTGRVKSPTYTLLETYEINGQRILHFDLYRFQDENEWEAAGFRDEMNGNNICLIEWPEKAAQLMPTPDLELWLDSANQRRILKMRANTNNGMECLKQLQN